MPHELKGAVIPLPDGMPELTVPFEFNEVWVAKEFNMLPSEFSMLDWDEQEKLYAYVLVKQKIDSYYQYAQEQYYKNKEDI